MNKSKPGPRPLAPPVYRPAPPQQPVQGKVPSNSPQQKTPLLPPPVYRPNPSTPARTATPPKHPIAPPRVQPQSPVQRKPAPVRHIAPHVSFSPAPYRPAVVQRAAAENKEIKAPLVVGGGVRKLVKIGKSIWGECRDLLESIKADLGVLPKIAEKYKSRSSAVIGIFKKATGYADTATHLFPPAKLVTTPLSYAAKILKALTTIRDLVNLLGNNPIEGVPLLLVDHLQQLHAALESAVLSLEGLESDDKLFDVLDDIQGGINKVKGWVEKASAS